MWQEKAIAFNFPRINYWEINQVTSECQIDILDETSKKRSKTEKEFDGDHPIFHILNSLGSNFQLRLTTLIVWIKFTQKGYSQSKK